MQTASTEERQMLRDSIRKLMERHATTEYVRQLDSDQAYPETLYAEWVKAGLIAMPFPGIWRARRQRHRLGDHRRGTLPQSTDLTMAFGGSVFCGLNVAKATPRSEAILDPQAAIR